VGSRLGVPVDPAHRPIALLVNVSGQLTYRHAVHHGGEASLTAGSGDVLTGVVAAFLAKGLAPELAAAVAAVAHGRAAQLIEPALGVVAGDVARMLPSAISEAR